MWVWHSWSPGLEMVSPDVEEGHKVGVLWHSSEDDIAFTLVGLVWWGLSGMHVCTGGVCVSVYICVWMYVWLKKD